MNILWIAAFNETEYDIASTFEQMHKHKLQIICPKPKNDYFFKVDMSRFDNIIYTKDQKHFIKGLDDYLRNNDVDLIIKRGGWGTQDAPFTVPTIAKQYNIPCALWCSEQGEQRDWQVGIARNYNVVLVNNNMDLEYYRIVFPYKKIFLLPFGCVPKFHKPVKPKKKYKTDIVVYGNPLYFDYKSKRRCIQDMIFPLISDYKVSIWGLNTWKKIDYIKQAGIYKGAFPYSDIAKVNSSCKIMLGMSASIFHGGYGSKLMRALSCRTFTIWHDTVGIDDDFTNEHNLILVNSPEETLEMVDYYLRNRKERLQIAKQGREYAVKVFDYKVLFDSLFNELYEEGVL